MKLYSRCLPIGTLPYENLQSAVLMQAKIYEKIPYLCCLPHINPEDNI